MKKIILMLFQYVLVYNCYSQLSGVWEISNIGYGSPALTAKYNHKLAYIEFIDQHRFQIFESEILHSQMENPLKLRFSGILYYELQGKSITIKNDSSRIILNGLLQWDKFFGKIKITTKDCRVFIFSKRNRKIKKDFESVFTTSVLFGLLHQSDSVRNICLIKNDGKRAVRMIGTARLKIRDTTGKIAYIIGLPDHLDTVKDILYILPTAIKQHRRQITLIQHSKRLENTTLLPLLSVPINKIELIHFNSKRHTVLLSTGAALSGGGIYALSMAYMTHLANELFNPSYPEPYYTQVVAMSMSGTAIGLGILAAISNKYQLTENIGDWKLKEDVGGYSTRNGHKNSKRMIKLQSKL